MSWINEEVSDTMLLGYDTKSKEKKKTDVEKQPEDKSGILIGQLKEDIHRRLISLDHSIQYFDRPEFRHIDYSRIQSSFSLGTDSSFGSAAIDNPGDPTEFDYDFFISHIGESVSDYSESDDAGPDAKEIQRLNESMSVITFKKRFGEAEAAKETKPSDPKKPRFAHIYKYPGFDPEAPTPLPGPGAKRVLQIVARVTVKLHSRSPRFRADFGRLFFSEMSLALLQDVFWYVFLQHFQPRPQDHRLLFDRAARNYVQLFFPAAHPQRSDAFFKDYPELMSQAVYVAFCHSFPDSFAYFAEERFRDELVFLVYGWMAGLKPSPRLWLGWRLSELESPNMRAKALKAVEMEKSMAFNFDYLDTLVSTPGSETSRGSVSPLSQSSFSYYSRRKSSQRSSSGGRSCRSRTPSPEFASALPQRKKSNRVAVDIGGAASKKQMPRRKVTAWRSDSGSDDQQEDRPRSESCGGGHTCGESPGTQNRAGASRPKSSTFSTDLQQVIDPLQHRPRSAPKRNCRRSSVQFALSTPRYRHTKSSDSELSGSQGKSYDWELSGSQEEISRSQGKPYVTEISKPHRKSSTKLPRSRKESSVSELSKSLGKISVSMPATRSRQQKRSSVSTPLKLQTKCSVTERPWSTRKESETAPSKPQGKCSVTEPLGSGRTLSVSRPSSAGKSATQDEVDSPASSISSRSHGSRAGKVSSGRKSWVMRSHPAGEGPDFLRSNFNVQGRSPLVTHFLRTHNLTSDLNNVVRVEHAHIEKLPPMDAPTYQDVIQASAGRIRELEQRMQEIKARSQKEASAHLRQQQGIMRDIKRKHAAVLSNRNEVKSASAVLTRGSNKAQSGLGVRAVDLVDSLSHLDVK